MKLRLYIFIFLLGLLISCSKDDPKDDPQPEMGWFPVKITKTDYLIENASRTIEIEYNNKNQISKIEITPSDATYTNGYDISYNSSNMVETMHFSSTHPDNKAITTYTFNYEAGVIVSWNTNTVAPNGDYEGSGFRPVTFNHPTYSVDGDHIDVDINQNISRMHGFFKNNSGSVYPGFFIHRLPDAGVFENVEPKTTLQLLFTIYFRMEMDFYAFSRHEISHLQLPSQTVDFLTTRNSEGQISRVLTANGSNMYARYDYEYEERAK